MTNTDLTEGRGQLISVALCPVEATARRLAAGRYIMGSDCPIEQVPGLYVEGQWYVPVRFVPLEEPRASDISKQACIDKKREVMAKAKRLGLSDQEINELMSRG